MKRHILMGAPGAGKTATLRQLERLGRHVVEEAATDVIALAQARGEPEPWTGERFLEEVLALQQLRRARADAAGWAEQIHDRSPVCTYALALFLGRPVPAPLAAELARIRREATFEREVFVLEPIGFCTPTAARRISYSDSLAFAAAHEAAYREEGYELVRIGPDAVTARASAILARLAAGGAASGRT